MAWPSAGAWAREFCSEIRNMPVESAALSVGLSALLDIVLAFVIYPPALLMGDAAHFHNFVFTNDALHYRLAWQALVDRGRRRPSL